MYVAVKGGERAIENAHRLLAEERRGDPTVPELSLSQIEQQLALAVDRVMSEGSLYDRELAALAIKQARGDLIEAIFLLRAYRTTLPRFGTSRPLDTDGMACGAGSRPPSRICRAARSSGPRSTTRTGCSTSSWPGRRNREAAPTRGRRRGPATGRPRRAAAARGRSARPRGPDRGRGARRRDRRPSATSRASR